MKTEDLKEQGLNDEQIKFVMAENGKDIKKIQRENENLTAERDGWKEKAEAAESTLKKFDGVDVDTMQKEISEWKKKVEDAEKDYNQKIYDRDFEDVLKSEMENVKFTSEAAKKSILSEIKDAGLKLVDGKILGLNDLIDQIKGKDASAFVNEEQEQAKQSAAKFTTPTVNQPAKTMSKADIMSIKDRKERRAAIAKNIGLFKEN